MEVKPYVNMAIYASAFSHRRAISGLTTRVPSMSNDPTERGGYQINKALDMAFAPPQLGSKSRQCEAGKRSIECFHNGERYFNRISAACACACRPSP